MVNYNQGKIYKLCCKDVNVKEFYIGSTCNELKVRKYNHKITSTNSNDKSYNLKVYKYIRENGGFENWDIVLVEEYKECNNKMELHQKERYYIELLGATLNSRIPNRTKKEYYEDNKEQIKEHKKEYYENNKEHKKEYYENNKEQIKEYQKEYREDNKDKINEKNKEKVKCNICNKEMNKGNLSRHKKRLHK